MVGEPRLHAPELQGMQQPQGAGGEAPQRACPTAACLPSCGLVLDRDENVTSNLLRFSSGKPLVDKGVNHALYLP